MKDTYLKKAAAFLTSQTYATVNQTALALAKRAIIDFFGCAIAGCQQDVVQRLANYCASMPQHADSTAFIHGKKLSQTDAAMLNAVAGHALDFDDTSWTTIAHPTIVAAAVALAEAQQLGRSGRDVLAAYCIGIEVAHTLAKVTMPAVSERGWHTTSVFGTFIATAVSCWMRQFDETTTVHALGLSLSRAGGIRSNFGTMTKPLHAGLAAKAGMECASMAHYGITASPKAFEDKDGFVDCFAGLNNIPDVEFGQPWDLAENGLAFKMYPCCSGAHPALDLIASLMADNTITADTVQSIHAGVSLLSPCELVHHRPQTPLQARFSLEYTLSAMLLRGQLTLGELTEACCQSPDIQALMQRITMDVDEELAKLGFIGTAPVKLTITLKDGTVIRAANDLAKGNPEKPLSDKELTEKFTRNSIKQLGESQTTHLLDALFSLEKKEDINEIMALACQQ